MFISRLPLKGWVFSLGKLDSPQSAATGTTLILPIVIAYLPVPYGAQ